MRRIALFILLLFPLPVAAQITSVKAEYGDTLPSRGSFAVIRGANFATGEELAVDISSLPRDLAGVKVDINGVLCGLRYVSWDTIRLVIPDETPFVTPVRLKPNVLTVTTAAGVKYSYRLYLNDSSPFILTALDTNYPFGVQVGPGGWMGIDHGYLQAPAKVQMWATGARSFYRADWVSYAVWIITENGDVYSTPARVVTSGIVEGIDYILFETPAEWEGLGNCRLLLQTTSAFSQEVGVRF